SRALGLHVAAARELFEEAGILFADTKPGVDLAAVRKALLAKTPAGKHSPPPSAFVEALAEAEAALRLDALVPLSRWITPEVETSRFDTHFFVAELPPGQSASHDDTEGTTSLWLPPARAIEDNATGVIRLPPPTLRTLECVGAFSDVASVLADARSRKPPVLRPQLVIREGGRFSLVLPGAPEHPEPGPVIAGTTCFLVREDGSWFSARPEEVPPVAA
ncbi:MAG: hypothetical protein IT379_19145, partial [Deltaproteobacteria bacterium]|nr:hypothetical protein [Deltaproteobacteria bacterium]